MHAEMCLLGCCCGGFWYVGWPALSIFFLVGRACMMRANGVEWRSLNGASDVDTIVADACLCATEPVRLRAVCAFIFRILRLLVVRGPLGLRDEGLPRRRSIVVAQAHQALVHAVDGGHCVRVGLRRGEGRQEQY